MAESAPGIGTQVELDLFASTEAFLTAYARTSLLLFPDPRKGKEFAAKRGAALREFLSVPSHHPIGKRGLRNDWMHYDERLDELIQRSDRGRWGFMVLPGAASASEAAKKEFMRLIDPTTEELFFVGKRYSLLELAGHIDDVREAIRHGLASIDPAADA